MAETERKQTTYAVRAVERTLDILDVLARNPGGLTGAAIANAVSMPRSTAFRYLAVLEARQYVSRFDELRFRLGTALLSFEEPAISSLAAAARPFLERLRDQRGETTNLGILVGTRVLYADVLESARAVRLSARRGDRDFLHSSALGKAIGAQLAEDEVRGILLAEGMPQLTPHTIVDVDAFVRELDLVRERGFATDLSESEEGASCVAVSIGADGLGARAAISLSCPSARFREAGLDDLVADLRAAAAAISNVVRQRAA